MAKSSWFDYFKRALNNIFVLRQCAAAYGLNHLGPEGYHWRVFVEDKHPIPGGTDSLGGTSASFSWWDIQDENASLPIKEARQSHLNKFFGPHAMDHTSDGDDYAKTAKGALKSLGKAMSHVTGATGEDHSSPTIKVVAFKLLDIVKMHDDFASKHSSKPPLQQQHQHAKSKHAKHPSSGSGTGYTAPPHQPAISRNNVQQQQQHPQRVSTSATPSASRSTQPPRTTAPPSAASHRKQQQETSLMDFGVTTSSTSKTKPPVNETRAEKLKREYAEKNAQANRVWDPVDERWVEVESKQVKPSVVSSSARSIDSGISSISFGDDDLTKKKVVGIKLDPANAAGKSATVQAAVHARVNEMKQSQAKALQEVRERENKKKQDEAEEDAIRKQLEPKIKAWSEEHGKKKQLRALLASLHTILWPGAEWKQVTIGDLLDAKKVKVQFHKASRVVHPDKTHHLPPDQRFLAKRIFDSLSQAKNEFDESGGK